MAVKKKTCTCCEETKPLECFGKQRSGDGHSSQCKDCVYEKAKARRAAKANGTYVPKGSSSGSTMRAKSKALIHHAKTRAKKKGIKCSITSEEIEEKLNHALCEKTGIPFDFSSKGDGSRSIYAPTIDRIDPSLGYTSTNTQVVIMAYNGLKST